MKKTRLRHAVIFYIMEEAMLETFQTLSSQKYTRLILKDVPKDAEVTRCWYDPARGAFGFFLEHPSFPEVNNGERPREQEILCEFVDVRQTP